MPNSKNISSKKLDSIVTSSGKILTTLPSAVVHNPILRSINHEVRSPLNAALTGLLLLDSENPPIQKKDLIAIVKHSVLAATNALNDALLLDLFHSNTLLLDFFKSDVCEIVANVIDVIRVEADLKDISIQFQKFPNKPLVANIDRIKISQVLRNVILLAIRSTPQKGLLAIFLTRSHSLLRIEVHSKAPSNLAPFKRRHSSGSIAEMHPLAIFDEGLIAYRRIVEMHGGKMGRLYHSELLFGYYIDVPLNELIETSKIEGVSNKASSEDVALYSLEGSSVIIDTVSTNATENAPLDRLDDDDDSKLLPLRFLIVDDSGLCRKMVAAKMKTYNVICEEVENGAEAVIRVMTADSEGITFDCIVMDNTMPVLEGPTATKMIRAFGYNGKIFGATGNVLSQELDYFLSQGLDRVFAKPLNARDYDFIYRSVTGVELTGVGL